MPASPELIEHARDLFANIGSISTGGLFGGSALYVEGDIMFACIISETIYMKSDESTEAAFTEAGSEPFTYPKKNGGQTIVASLMSLPDSANDDPEEAQEWARMSYAPALKAAEKKRVEKARKAAKKLEQQD